MTDGEKEITDKIREFEELFKEQGNQCGREIEAVVKKLHPGALTFPLYRGCTAIPLNQEGYVEHGALLMYHYHDPHWMGYDEITEENLRGFMDTIVFKGQRSGVDILVNYGKLSEEWLWTKMYHSRLKSILYGHCAETKDMNKTEATEYVKQMIFDEFIKMNDLEDWLNTPDKKGK